jgi:hypothetical protein
VGWKRHEMVTAVIWALVTPLVLAGAGWALGAQIGEAAWWIVLPAPFLMGVLGGLTIRVRGPWTDVLLLASYGALVVAFGVFIVGMSANPSGCYVDPKASQTGDCDTAYGLGAALIFVMGFLALLPGLYLGKAVGRRVTQAPPRPKAPTPL